MNQSSGDPKARLYPAKLATFEMELRKAQALKEAMQI